MLEVSNAFRYDFNKNVKILKDVTMNNQQETKSVKT